MILKIIANLEGGDLVTPDNELTYKIYGSANNYSSPIANLGSALNDPKVNITESVVTIENVDVGSEDIFKISSVDAAGNEAELSDASSAVLSKFYARPAGTTYGNSDGTSYANAFTGFDNINWQLISGNILAICGNHFQTLTIGSSDVTIIGNDENESGIIDGELARASCIDVDNCNNVTINDIDLQRGLVQCLFVRGTSQNCITNNGIFSNSGNQGIQHYGTSTAIHNNPTCVDNVDDGISLHNSTIVIVNGGVMNGNDQQINNIQNSKCTINGTQFLNGISFDIFSAASITKGSCNVEINNVTCDKVSIENGAFGLINNCEFENADFSKKGEGSEIIINSSVVKNGEFSNNKVIANNCNLKNIVLGVTQDFIFTNSFVEPFSNVRITSGSLVFNRCLIDQKNNSSSVALDIDGGQLKIINSILVNNTSTNFYLGVRNNVNSELIFDNNNIIGNGNTTRGILNFKTSDLIINNNIFIDHSLAILGSQTIISNNTLFFNNNTNTSQNVTQNNSVVGNPLFVDKQNLNFALGVTSPAMGVGVLIDETIGLESANWLDEIPVIVTKQRTNPPNIGAFA